MCFDLFDTKKQEFLSADDLDEIMRAMGFRPSKEELQVGIIMFWGFKPARNGAPLGQEAQLGFRRRQQRARLSQIGFLAQANPCQEELQVSSFKPRKGLLKVGIICWV